MLGGVLGGVQSDRRSFVLQVGSGGQPVAAGWPSGPALKYAFV